MNIRLIIFDLDGTLVDTAPAIAEAINDVLRQEYLPELPVSEVRGLIGEGTRMTMARAYARSEARLPENHDPCVLPDKLTLDRLMSVFASVWLSRSSLPGTLYPEVRSTLTNLRAAGVKLALVTNKEESFVRPMLAALGLLKWFDPIVGGDTLPTRKPDPAPVKHCLVRHRLAPAQALFVGDSDLDVLAARGAGVRSVLVAHGYGTSHTADMHITSLGELLERVAIESPTHEGA